MGSPRSDDILSVIRESNGKLSPEFISDHGDTFFYNSLASEAFMENLKKPDGSLSNEVLFNLTQSLMQAHLQDKQTEPLLRAQGFLSGKLYVELAKRTGYDPWDKNHPIPEHFNVLNWYVHQSISSIQHAQAKTNKAKGLQGAPTSDEALAEMTMGVILTKTKKEDALGNLTDMAAMNAQIAKEQTEKKDPDRIAKNINAGVLGESAPQLAEGYKFDGLRLYKAVNEIFTTENTFINDLVAMREPVKAIAEMKKGRNGRQGSDEFYQDLAKMISVAEKIKEKYPNGMRDVITVGSDNLYSVDPAKLADYLKMVNEAFELSVKISENFKNGPDFMNDCKLALKNNMINETQKQNLPQKLITPTQRMPRYQILLDAVVKECSPDQASVFTQAIDTVKNSFVGTGNKSKAAYSEKEILDDIGSLRSFVSKLPVTSGTKKEYRKLMQEIDKCLEQTNYPDIAQIHLPKFRQLAYASKNKTHGSKDSKTLHANIEKLCNALMDGIENKIKAEAAAAAVAGVEASAVVENPTPSEPEATESLITGDTESLGEDDDLSIDGLSIEDFTAALNESQRTIDPADDLSASEPEGESYEQEIGGELEQAAEQAEVEVEEQDFDDDSDLDKLGQVLKNPNLFDKLNPIVKQLDALSKECHDSSNRTKQSIVEKIDQMKQIFESMLKNNPDDAQVLVNLKVVMKNQLKDIQGQLAGQRGLTGLKEKVDGLVGAVNLAEHYYQTMHAPVAEQRKENLSAAVNNMKSEQLLQRLSQLDEALEQLRANIYEVKASAQLPFINNQRETMMAVYGENGTTSKLADLSEELMKVYEGKEKPSPDLFARVESFCKDVEVATLPSLAEVSNNMAVQADRKAERDAHSRIAQNAKEAQPAVKAPTPQAKTPEPTVDPVTPRGPGFGRSGQD